jgi:hypothetical protein
MSPRRAEARDTREWQKDVAAANELEEVRTWVVWGVSAPPKRAAEERERPGRPGDEVARGIARTNDAEWPDGSDEAWVILLEADEDEVDAWVLEDESVRGYAPYLMEPENAAARPERMRGVLRGDVVRRRKPRRFDAGMPG